MEDTRKTKMTPAEKMRSYREKMRRSRTREERDEYKEKETHSVKLYMKNTMARKELAMSQDEKDIHKKDESGRIYKIQSKKRKVADANMETLKATAAAIGRTAFNPYKTLQSYGKALQRAQLPYSPWKKAAFVEGRFKVSPMLGRGGYDSETL